MLCSEGQNVRNSHASLSLRRYTCHFRKTQNYFFPSNNPARARCTLIYYREHKYSDLACVCSPFHYTYGHFLIMRVKNDISEKCDFSGNAAHYNDFVSMEINNSVKDKQPTHLTSTCHSFVLLVCFFKCTVSTELARSLGKVLITASRFPSFY